MSKLRRELLAIRHHGILYAFVLPAVVLIALFQYYPALSGIYHSFYRWNGSDIAEWVGFENYSTLIGNEHFWASFKLALLLGAFNILKMAPALVVAVCIHRCRSERMQYLYRILLVAPMVIPPLVIALIWRSFFFETSTGVLNQFLNASGAKHLLVMLDHWMGWGGVFTDNSNPAWLGDPRLVITAIIIWGFPWVGSFAILIHLAKLQQIPRSIYEAADIDGIGWFGKFSSIELPLMLSSIQLLLVFVIIDTIKDAGMVLALTNIYGGPGGVATVPALFMLQRAFIDQQFGAACATGIVLTIIVLVLQKISSILVGGGDEEPSRHWPQALMKLMLAVAGAALVVTGQSYFIGAVMLALVIPWRRVLEPLGALWPRSSRVPRANAAELAPWRRKLANLWPRGLKHATVLAVLALAYFPMYLTIVVSLKSNTQFYADPVTPSAPFHTENWLAAWRAVTPSVANTLFVAGSATMLILAIGLFGSYFFARRAMPGSALLWNALLVLMMMPTIANLIPLFRLLGDMGLLNTLTALILVGTSGGVVFAIFVLRSFLADLPRDLFEAAEIDGASHHSQLWNVALPLSGPALGTVAIMQFILIWNDFILPLVIIRDADRLPVMVQLLRMAGEYVKFWGPLMAGYAMASLPIIVLFVLSMRLFVRGLSEGAVKA